MFGNKNGSRSKNHYGYRESELRRTNFDRKPNFDQKPKTDLEEEDNFGVSLYDDRNYDPEGSREFNIGSLPNSMGNHDRPPDERIREDVCEILKKDATVDTAHIEVSVQSGIVTLSGLVGDRREKRRAQNCAKRALGVDDVRNELRIGKPQ